MSWGAFLRSAASADVEQALLNVLAEQPRCPVHGTPVEGPDIALGVPPEGGVAVLDDEDEPPCSPDCAEVCDTSVLEGTTVAVLPLGVSHVQVTFVLDHDQVERILAAWDHRYERGCVHSFDFVEAIPDIVCQALIEFMGLSDG